MQWRSARVWPVILPLLAATLISGCEENGINGPRIATLEVTSGNNQTGSIGALLPQPLIVQVKDQTNAPIAGAEVTFVVTSGNGTVSPRIDTTDANGFAQTTLRLGSTVGVQTVSASLPGLSPITFAENAVAAPASKLAAAGGDAQIGEVGSQLPVELVVKVTDAFDNPKAGIPVSFAVGAGGGALNANLVLTDAQGLARVRWTLGTAAGTQSVTASTGALVPLTFTATATPDAPASIVVVSGGNQTASPGAVLPDSIVVRVVDQYGNGVGGVTVDWIATTGNGSVSPSTTATNASGRTAARWTLGGNGGPMMLQLRAGTVQGTVGGAAFIVFESVSSGGRSSCGIDDGGVAYCWGFNGDGQLGIGAGPTGSGPIYSVPQAVPPVGSQTFTAVNSGRYHSCALTFSHVGYCWGDNNNGQVGIGSNTRSASEPTLISVAVPFSAIAAGRAHSCGIAIGGRPYCWGDNERGQLGGNVTIDTTLGTVLLVPANEPKLVGSTTDGRFFGSFDVIAIAAGGVHSCAIMPGGAALCWGLGREGQRGDGTNSLSQYIPSLVAGGNTFDAITAGYKHSCARTTGGAVLCWGDNTDGQLGTGSNNASNVPVGVTGGLSLAAITAGLNHTCGITTGGAAFCWGSNSHGQLGDGTTNSQTGPVAVAGGLTFASIAAGDYHTCGVTTGSVAFCWGDNEYGAIGDGTRVSRPTPTKVRFQQ